MKNHNKVKHNKLNKLNESKAGSRVGGRGVGSSIANGQWPKLGSGKELLSLLLPYQRRWVEDPARYKIGVWSRQTGKSLCTAVEAVMDCMHDPGTTWVCLSAGERQALEWLDKAKLWTWAMQAVVSGETED